MVNYSVPYRHRYLKVSKTWTAAELAENERLRVAGKPTLKQIHMAEGLADGAMVKINWSAITTGRRASELIDVLNGMSTVPFSGPEQAAWVDTGILIDLMDDRNQAAAAPVKAGPKHLGDLSWLK